MSAKCGVSRFIFLSSVKVFGEGNLTGASYDKNSTPNPKSGYAKSKWMTERELLKIGSELDLQIIVLRLAPLFRGDQSGNLSKLNSILMKRPPFFPRGPTKTRRSFLSIENLHTLIQACLTQEGNVTGIYIVSDNETLSTEEIVRLIVRERKSRLPFQFTVPAPIVSIFIKTPLKRIFLSFLNFTVDNTETRRFFNWNPHLKSQFGLENALVKLRDC